MSPGTLWPCCFLCATQTFLSSSRWDVCVPAGRREALPAGACPTEWLCDDLLKHLTRTQLARFGPLTSSVHWAHTWDLRFFSPHATALLQGLFKTGNALMNQGSDGLWNSSQPWSEKSKSPSVTLNLSGVRPCLTRAPHLQTLLTSSFCLHMPPLGLLSWDAINSREDKTVWKEDAGRNKNTGENPAWSRY